MPGRSPCAALRFFLVQLVLGAHVNRHLSAIAMAATAVWSTHPAFAQTAPAPAPGQETPAPPAPAQPAAAAPPPAATAELEKQIAVQRADIDEQDARIQELEQALKALKPTAAPPPPKV